MDQRRAIIRLHGELNDFLQPDDRHRDLRVLMQDTPSVKDAIESMNVPHVEVGLILIDGRPAGFEETLHGDERVEVYPLSDTPDTADAPALRPQEPSPPRFIADVHLKKLARDLRLLGFDTTYADKDHHHDPLIAAQAADDDRIALTRDVGLLKRKIVQHGRWVRATVPNQQIVEIMDRYGLAPLAEPFKRCLVCNGLLKQTTAEEVEGEAPAELLESDCDFHRCQSCRRVFWPGSHHDRLVARVERLLKEAARP